MGPALAETGLAGLAVAVLLMTAGPPLLRILFGHAWSDAADLLPAAGLYVAAAHLTAVLAAWASARGDAGKVATMQLATQALSWPVQLAAAAWSGMTAVLILRGIVELVRAVLLLRTCGRRQHAPMGEAAAA